MSDELGEPRTDWLVFKVQAVARDVVQVEGELPRVEKVDVALPRQLPGDVVIQGDQMREAPFGRRASQRTLASHHRPHRRPPQLIPVNERCGVRRNPGDRYVVLSALSAQPVHGLSSIVSVSYTHLTLPTICSV
eukprot:2356420-Prymnesium_polylepis.1